MVKSTGMVVVGVTELTTTVGFTLSNVTAAMLDAVFFLAVSTGSLAAPASTCSETTP